MKNKIIDAIKTVYDPEIPVNIYELGLIYEIDVYDTNDVYIKMTLTSPTCPVADLIINEVQEKVEAIDEINEARVEITFDPTWDHSMMSEVAKLELGFL